MRKESRFGVARILCLGRHFLKLRGGLSKECGHPVRQRYVASVPQTLYIPVVILSVVILRLPFSHSYGQVGAVQYPALTLMVEELARPVHQRQVG